MDDADDFQVIKALAELADWSPTLRSGRLIDKSAEARIKYVNQVLSFVDVDALRPLKVVVNSGNGAAGPTFDAIAQRLIKQNAPLELVRINHTPDHTFPNGIPNPLLVNMVRAGKYGVKMEVLPKVRLKLMRRKILIQMLLF